MRENIKIEGINYLIKTLSINLYDVYYYVNDKDLGIKLIEDKYSINKIITMMTELLNNNGFEIIKVFDKKDNNQQYITFHFSKNQDEELICCNQIQIHTHYDENDKNNLLVAHMDITEIVRGDNIALEILESVIEIFDADVVLVDYHVRGYVTDNAGRKFFNDSEIYSLKDYINTNVISKYEAYDMNMVQSNSYHTKMVGSEIKCEKNVCDVDYKQLDSYELLKVKKILNQEILAIFTNKNY